MNESTNPSSREKRRAYFQAWYAKNRSKKNASSRAWNLKNREKCRTADRARYIDNRDKFIAQAREYATKNRDKVRATDRARRAKWSAQQREKQRARVQKWRAENPEKARAYCLASQNARRARKVAATIGCKKMVKKIHHACAILRKRGLDLSVDHVIPLAKGGTHSPDNLQIIYREQNLIKNHRLDYHATVVFHYPLSKLPARFVTPKNN
jgi:5-methylcytosine-specific restriction endonuclease McrA